ncbi:MAG TPA: hypothetical protein VIV20_00170 [Gammaproteobacteria bacterium]
MKIIPGLLVLLALVSIVSRAEEENPAAKLDEINEMVEAEQELNMKLKGDVDTRDAELARLKQKLEALEEELNEQNTNN